MGQRNPINHQFGMVESRKSWDVYHLSAGFVGISLAHPQVLMEIRMMWLDSYGMDVPTSRYRMRPSDVNVGL